ncbi:hypothetical protein RvVAR031_39000 [Agrobacterium vitis]|nr:hypothetical protein RvVAR031_39000 [Agrobacterium vitis]
MPADEAIPLSWDWDIALVPKDEAGMQKPSLRKPVTYATLCRLAAILTGIWSLLFALKTTTTPCFSIRTEL